MPNTLLCNYINDCGDNSDEEEYCGNVIFSFTHLNIFEYFQQAMLPALTTSLPVLMDDVCSTATCVMVIMTVEITVTNKTVVYHLWTGLPF